MKKKKNNLKKIYRKDLFEGMSVQDINGQIGVIRNCKDLHNVHVTFDGEGIEIDWYETTFECGESGLYCFFENCVDNSEKRRTIIFYK